MKTVKFFSMLAIIIALFLSSANSQSNTASVTRDIFDIGYAVYTKGATKGTLNAIWNYANMYSGKGKATGISKEGFAGNYHITGNFGNLVFGRLKSPAIENLIRF